MRSRNRRLLSLAAHGSIAREAGASGSASGGVPPNTPPKGKGKRPRYPERALRPSFQTAELIRSIMMTSTPESQSRKPSAGTKIGSGL